ncbi:phage tail protein [Kribbella sp. CA-253562]|uniref:phage tail protein n=1 Tax=Kribbella sp. CA-253562 TaxID=3239942 RepID=UPI003D8BCFA1
MRGTVDGLENPHPLLQLLPALYVEDDFATRFVAAFDDLLAPVMLTLDNITAYLDPALTPADFLRALASWVAAFDHADLDEERKRRLTSEAMQLHRQRGTAAGLARTIELATGFRPEITESGGTSWSITSGSEPPGHAAPGIVVRVTRQNGLIPGVDLFDLVSRIVEDLRPAHLPAHVEIVEGTDDRDRRQRTEQA